MSLRKFIGHRAGMFEHALLVGLLVLLALLFEYKEVLWRWNYVLYDAQLSLWERTPSDEIVIVAIDDQSLTDIGRWPWPRAVHGELIARISQESPRVIGLDVILAEPDLSDPASDLSLARAMQASGNVVLPVFMSSQGAGSVPIESLPLPLFTQAAAALGHVHIDISEDGIARKVYLREGIGEPHWPHYGLAILDLLGRVDATRQGALVAPTVRAYSPLLWNREHPYLIPYAGPPGHFRQLGYSQVLAGQYPRDLFRDRIVLIGATAEGLGDALPTPWSGRFGVMPGVEIVANVIDALDRGLSISTPATAWRLLATALLVALPLLVYPWLNPARTLLVLIASLVMSLVLVALLLWGFGIWLPVATILLFQVVSYPLWSWRRLELAMRHINSELNQLTVRRSGQNLRRKRDLHQEIAFVNRFVPIKGWIVVDQAGNTLQQQGTAPANNLGQLVDGAWRVDGYRYWALTWYRDQYCRIGLSLGADAEVSDHALRLLDNLIQQAPVAESGHNIYAEDVLQTKIEQVRTAAEAYEELRRIIDDSLAGMADGVLICNALGQVLLSNKRAGWYLQGDDEAQLNGRSLEQVVGQLQVESGRSWNELLGGVLFDEQREIAQARHEAGRDLLIELSPLMLPGDRLHGFIVNLSDISLLKESERKRNQVLDFLSHDLRSPLASMIAMIELTRAKDSIDEIRGMLGVMEKNTHKTLHLAEQFLQLSRVNSVEKIRYGDVDMNTIALNVVDQLWALANKKRVRLEYDFEHDECWTRGDADLLERAMQNLAANAIKFSPEQGRVVVSISLRQDEIHCEVADQGPGISAPELPHLFEMYRQARGGVERKQGVGLGLAFVDAVAKRHEGYVEVESAPGQGARFSMIIPRRAVAHLDEDGQ